MVAASLIDNGAPLPREDGENCKISAAVVWKEDLESKTVCKRPKNADMVDS